MISQIISKLIVLFMLIALTMMIWSLEKKDKKKAVVWGILFALPLIALIVLFIYAANRQ